MRMHVESGFVCVALVKVFVQDDFDFAALAVMLVTVNRNKLLDFLATPDNLVE